MSLAGEYYLRHVVNAYSWLKRMFHVSCDRILELTGAQKIHCIGDSHLSAFRYISERHYFHRTIFKFCVVRGATASGILNPGSKTQGFTTFREYAENNISSCDWILTCLGEVDCGFVIWYRSNKYGSSIEKQFARAVDNYKNFLCMLKDNVNENIVVCSVPLPTIQDEQDWGEIAHLRKEVKASLRERTNLTLSFNQRLSKLCKKMGLFFLDLEKYVLNIKTMCVDKKYLHPNPLDHHLNAKVLAPKLVKELKNLGFR